MRSLTRWGLALAGLLLVLAGTVRAESIRLDAVPSGSLGLWASVFVEEEGELSLVQAQARQQAGLFRPGNRPALAFGIGSRPVWVRLELNNPTAQALSFHLALGTTWIDQLEIYVVRNGKVEAHWRTGDSHPRATGLVPAMGFVVTPQFGPGISELYVRAQTDDPLVLPIQLRLQGQPPSIAETTLQFSYGIFFGYLAALAIYNALLFIGLRKRSYLYYALYLVLFILLNVSYTGYGVAWLWPQAIEFQRYVIYVLMVAASACGLLFASNFLSLAREAPKVSRGVQWFSLTGLVLLLVCVIGDRQTVAALVAFTWVVLYTVLMVALGILVARKGLGFGRYFLAASLGGMFGACVTAVAIWGWLPFTLWTYRATEIGILVEASLLALALAEQIRRQDAARQNAEQQARTDTLTGLPNRRSFLESAEAIRSTASRNERPLSLVILDIDFFKRINDQYGHDAGDRVLIDVAQVLRESCRAGDILARWGGEEFVLLLPETDLEQAGQLAERIRQSIAGQRLTVKNRLIAYTASFGVAERSDTASLQHLLSEADERLYAAKSKGRNRVVGVPGPALQG